MNNKIGCLGWGIIIFAILVIIAYWQVALLLAIAGGIGWYFYEKSPKVQEKKKQIAIDKQKAQEEHQVNIQKWKTEDLAPLAQKIEGIKLRKTEYCYYYTYDPITWSESRHRTKRINYHGLTSNIHIMKGLNYRLGSIGTNSISEEYSKPIITGNLFLTNRRIIIYGSGNVKAYPFTRLISAKPYADGVELFSDSGKKVTLYGFKDATQFNISLDRLTSEDN